MSQIKRIAKKFIAYSIEGEKKVYRLKHTPLKIARCYTKEYHREYEKLPVVPNKIIFDNYMGKGFGCNGKYVTKELLLSKEAYDIVWTVKDALNHQQNFPAGVRLVEYGSKEALREYATAGVWVQNYHLVHYLNKGLLKKPEQSYIQMWHGSFGIKKIEGDCTNLTVDKNWTYLAKKNADYTDYWISNGSFETAVYRQAFWNVENVLEYGHPRNDIFFAEDIAEYKEKVRSHYGIQEEKLVVYVPTFRDEGMEWEQELDYCRLLTNLQKRFGGTWNALVRMHPRMKEYASKLIPASDLITDVTDYPDIQELLAAADVVITDYSSAIFDFLLTKKPGFIYAPDYKSYEQMRGLYYPLEDTPFPVAKDNTALEKNILEFQIDKYKEKAQDFLQNKGSVEDGKAAKRIVKFIEQIVAGKESESWNI